MNRKSLTRAERVRKKKLKDRLVVDQKNRCFYCGVLFQEDSADHFSSLDHLVPHSKGGDYFDGNCVAACFSCNQERGLTNWKAFKRYKEKTLDGFTTT